MNWRMVPFIPTDEQLRIVEAAAIAAAQHPRVEYVRFALPPEDVPPVRLEDGEDPSSSTFQVGEVHKRSRQIVSPTGDKVWAHRIVYGDQDFYVADNYVCFTMENSQ